MSGAPAAPTIGAVAPRVSSGASESKSPSLPTLPFQIEWRGMSLAPPPPRRGFPPGRGPGGGVSLVRDGRVREAAGERARRGPGVLLMDHCSAAVLRTDLRFTRTVGPGTVAFTEPYEWLAASLDLRRQRRTLLAGPPTTGAAAGEQEISTLGITRDGVPVTATLHVTFIFYRKSPLARGAISA